MEDLTDLPPGRMVVVGIGNSLRADDAAGCIVAERLAPSYPDRVFDAGETPENFMGPLRRAAPGVVVLVDAADFGGRPGETRVASADDVGGLMLGTHAAPLSLFMKVLTQETGARVVMVAIQATTTALGGSPSAAVVRAAETLAQQLEAELDRREGR